MFTQILFIAVFLSLLPLATNFRLVIASIKPNANKYQNSTSICPLQCVHGICQFSPPAACLCEDGYTGELCQIQQNKSSWIEDYWWTFLISLFGICFLLKMILSCRRTYERREAIKARSGFVQLDRQNEETIDLSSDDEGIEMQTRETKR